MGITKHVLKFILLENDYKPLYGNILLVGRSTISVDYETLSKLFVSFGLTPPEYTLKERVTKHQADGFGVDDKVMFSAFSDQIEKIDVLDVSPYEGANVLVDLNHPIPEELFSQYDFIFDSSVIDNLFNPAEAIKNISLMLKPGGRYIGTNVCSFFPGAMVSCHPEWFYSFFAVNNFVDVKAYLMEQNEPGKSRFEYSACLYKYRPTFTPKPGYNHFEAVQKTNSVYHCLIVAEKDGSASNSVEFPINLQYIDSSNSDNWTTKDFSGSPRPWASSGDHRIFDDYTEQFNPPKLPHLTDHYVPINSGF